MCNQSGNVKWRVVGTQSSWLFAPCRSAMDPTKATLISPEYACPLGVENLFGVKDDRLVLSSPVESKNTLGTLSNT